MATILLLIHDALETIKYTWVILDLTMLALYILYANKIL